MANTGIVVINTVYNNGHSESVGRPGPRLTQLATISWIAVKDVHPWESPQRKLDFCVICGVEIVTNYFQFFSTAFDLCKTTLIYLRREMIFNTF